jgi:periplasmic protein CpxP/Spy
MRKQLMAGVVAVMLAGAGTFATADVLQAQTAPQANSAQQAGSGHGRGGRFAGRGGLGHRAGLAMLRQLDLTDQQREQVRTIMQSHKSDFEQVHQRIRTAFEAQHAAAQATPADEATIRAKATEVGAAEGDLAVLMKVRTEVFQILTPDQQAKAQQLQQQRAQRREQFQQKMQERRQQRQQNGQPPAGL